MSTDIDYAALKSIVLGARDLEGDARLRYLDDACAGQSELRAEVETVLAGSEAADNPFDGPLSGIDIAAIVADAMEENAPLPDQVGRYAIVRVLGRGGMGIVYEAEQEEPHRRVALKVIRPGLVAGGVLRRFRLEAEVLGRLRHPGIAQIFEAGTAGDQPFFAMEYVDGPPIIEYAKRRGLGTRDRLELVARIADALQHAHQNGVIHRDLKPSNILVTGEDDGGIGQPRILDFGVARATDADIQTVTVQTNVGELVGTVPYMSPEQAAGDPAGIDTRSDVYSLGVLAFELLSGNRPYDLSGQMLHDAVRIIREREATRLSTFDRDCRGDVETIVAKALEKEKDRRYASAGEMAADIRRFLGNQPIVARPASAVYQLRKFARRNRGVVTAVAALFVVLAAATAFSSILAVRESRERERADHNAKEAEARANELEIVSEFQAAQLRGIDVEQMANRLREDLMDEVRTVMAREGLAAEVATARADQLAALLAEANFTNVALKALDHNIFDAALSAVEEQFPGQDLVKARLLQTIAATRRDLGLLDEAAAPQLEAVALYRNLLGEDDERTLKAFNNLGLLRQKQGDLPEAERCYREALEGCRRALGDDDPQTLDSLNNVGYVLWDQGKLAEAEPFLRAAIEGSRRILGEDHEDTLSSIGNMAALLRALGRLDDAEVHYRAALEGRRRVLGNDHPHTIISVAGMGTLLQSRGKLAEAEPYYREAVATGRRVNGDTHGDTLVAVNNLGTLLMQMGNLDEAEVFLRETYESRRRVLGPDHPQTVVSLGSMASLLRAQGKLDEAETWFRRSLEGRRRVYGEDHSRTLAAIHGMGILEQSRGRLAEAETHYRDALGRRERVLGEVHPHTLASRAALGNLFRLQERWAEAEPLLEAALDGRRRTLGDDHRETLESMGSLGLLLQQTGRLTEAEALLREAYDGRRRTLGAEHEQTLLSTGNLADVLSDVGRFDEAETLAHNLIETATATLGAKDWRIADGRSVLGAALTGQERYDEAEAALLAGHAGLERAPDDIRSRKLPKAVDRLVALYEAWGRPVEARDWRTRRGRLAH